MWTNSKNYIWESEFQGSGHWVSCPVAYEIGVCGQQRPRPSVYVGKPHLRPEDRWRQPRRTCRAQSKELGIKHCEAKARKRGRRNRCREVQRTSRGQRKPWSRGRDEKKRASNPQQLWGHQSRQLLAHQDLWQKHSRWVARTERRSYVGLKGESCFLSNKHFKERWLPALHTGTSP